ncbi:MAG: GSU2403 family nucleotidyltransferase fold protein [Acidobacteriota bacterium]
MIRRLDSTTQTIYAELLERSIHFEASNVLGAAGSGSLVEKRIKGRKYWYIQKSEGRGKRQLYLGPDSEPLQEWIAQVHEERSKNQVQREELIRLCAMVVSGGVSRESAGFVKVLEILGEAEVFRLGGVLIGTVAYRALGTTLGVEFDEAALRTQDIDIAQEPDLAVGLVHGTECGRAGERLLGSDLGIQPIPALDPRLPSTSYSIRSRDLRVDFLVPARSSQKSKTVFLPAFGLSATPLRFLEFLVESPIRTVVIGTRPVLVNVPDPARFALHKIYSAITRSASFQVKAAKDLRQASSLIEVLAEDRPDDLARAWQALKTYPKVSQRIRRAISRLGEQAAANLARIIE